MTYTEAMARTSADFWLMLWPLYLIAAGWLAGVFARWLTPKR